MFKRVIKGILRRVGYDLVRIPSDRPFRGLSVFDLGLSVLGRDLTAIQVGANDGVTGDDLRAHILSGRIARAVLIEPNPVVFARLERNYAGQAERLVFLRAAIGESGTVPFYVPDIPDGRGDFVDTLSSADRVQAEKAMRSLGMRTREIRVVSMPLSEVVERYGFRRLDVLVIDAEGYDLKVLKTLDFDRCAPALIQFESGHLDWVERREAMALLDGVGYGVIWLGGDTIAMRADIVGA